jgi:preprotein translocase subunit SecY
MAVLQGYGVLALLASQNVLTGTFDLSSFETLTQIATLTAGAIVLMWIGELITERGIGNGISFIIFAGIVGRMPQTIQQTVDVQQNFFALASIVIIGILVIAAIIFIQEGQRRIPVQYAKRVRGTRMYSGGSTHIPLRVNSAGVIPIIFAISILLLPSQVAQYFTTSETDWVASLSNGIVAAFANPVFYNSLYFLLVVAFTFFYTAFTFVPNDVADNIKRYGGFIPGIRPGRPTSEYLARVTERLTLVGALTLAFIAVGPVYLARGATGGTLTVYLAGTSLLIVVGVALETMKQLEAYVLMRHYEGFMK